jgi:hypothetical protein
MPQLPLTNTHAAQAAAHARRAIRRGDARAAKHWLEIAKHTVALASRFSTIAAGEAFVRRFPEWSAGAQPK